MKKLLLLLVFVPTLFSVGCASGAIPARMEVNSADVVNDIFVMKKKFNVYADAAELAVTDNDDKKVLKSTRDVINNDFDKTYKRALEHYKDIKDTRDK